MSNLQIALIVLAVLLVLGWLRLRRRGPGTSAKRAAAERIDTVIGWPPQATRVLGNPERIAFGTLVRALPEYMILAQVPLARFLDVPKRNSYADWLRRVGYQSVDFLICDMATQVVAVVELQALNPTDRARKRLTRITRTLKAAQIPLHVWRETALPSVSAVRDAILPPPARVDSAASAPAAASNAAAPANPFDDTNRDSTHDERIELLEPPPSTWFDDLDSDPVPLSKR